MNIAQYKTVHADKSFEKVIFEQNIIEINNFEREYFV